ncbi:uncharacterized protein BJ212DRAFT_1405867 [Suillus subaureus]|uniref:Uncharacterized protein n=1 Tax=Suillus subaureus TaxID=48587 RepID=A0A9P7IZ49_9AGAM|nr:uncharacterized protein BJ212DRAFT_1405867 [Suillus subaureus]KAG1797576.1 hypothetical protein BJ212DRAFT_1405867 [Suillus subaureus]
MRVSVMMRVYLLILAALIFQLPCFWTYFTRMIEDGRLLETTGDGSSRAGPSISFSNWVLPRLSLLNSVATEDGDMEAKFIWNNQRAVALRGRNNRHWWSCREACR